MDLVDEPVMHTDNDSMQSDTIDREPVWMNIRDLLNQQLFAVLCTQGSNQPYGSLVAYATNAALDAAVFATARATRKYSLLKECERIALVVDSRPSYPNELMKVEAITATGRARELADAERAPWAELLIDRHPQLKAFVHNPSTALFKIDITRYLIRHTLPGSSSVGAGYDISYGKPQTKKESL